MKKTMIIEGMMCMHCTGRVEKTLAAIDGVDAVEMSLEGKSATLTLSKDVDNKVLTDAVTAAYKKFVFHPSRETPIKVASLGNDAGIYGAVRLVLGADA